MTTNWKDIERKAFMFTTREAQAMELVASAAIEDEPDDDTRAALAHALKKLRKQLGATSQDQ